MWLILLFVGVPLTEMYLLVKMAEWTSWPVTFAVAIVTGIIGTALARRQGFHTLQRIQSELNQGHAPTTAVVDAFMIFAAGLLLMTPGILTDVVGFSLLVPFCRAAYRTLTLRWLKANFKIQGYTSQTWTSHRRAGPFGATSDDDEVIDSYVVRDSDSNSVGLPKPDDQ